MKKIYLFFLLTVCTLKMYAQTVNSQGTLGTSSNVVVGASNFHALEAIYHDQEFLGYFTTAGNAIDEIRFYIQSQSTPPFSVNFYKVYMKNIPIGTTTFTDGAYSLAGYTEVFSGIISVDVADGSVDVPLATPFVRTAGTNLQVLLTREDNLATPGTIFYTANGILGNATATSSRRYNNVTPLNPGVTNLTASSFRPYIAFRHIFPINASINSLDPISVVSCYNSPQTMNVEVWNEGTTPIAAGALTVTLQATGLNPGNYSAQNSQVILPNEVGIVPFNNINMNNPGYTTFKGFTTLAGDANALNDTLTLIGNYTSEILGTNLADFPIVEDVEGPLESFNYVQNVVGRQLWTIHSGNYTNPDQTSPLVPRTPGTDFFMFDSYDGAISLDFISRLYSKCIQVPDAVLPNPAPITTVSFWMNQDNLFPGSLDSVYLIVSNDRGQTWTRIAGFQRYDAASLTPGWRQQLVDISAYRGQVVQVGFEGVSKYGNIIGIDDISINFSFPVPVTLVDFTVRKNELANMLNWRTSQEQNSNRFIIERSNDGSGFAEIGSVAAAGNSSVTRNYSFTDANPVKGVNYYRLRLMDNDNRIAYSEVKSVRNGLLADMLISPNPVVDRINIRLNSDWAADAQIRVTDLSGRGQYSSKTRVSAGENRLNIPAGNLAAGVYLVTIQVGSQTLVQKITRL